MATLFALEVAQSHSSRSDNNEFEGKLGRGGLDDDTPLFTYTIRVFGRETGKATIDGNRLTITPGPGTLEYTDNCRPQMNSKKSTQMDQKKWQWEIGRDELGVKLCVRDAEGASACYYRQ